MTALPTGVASLEAENHSSRHSRLFAAAKVAAACALALPAAAQPNLDGVWSQVYNWPLISVHGAMTPEGRVLTYGTKADGTQTGFFIYDIWDPAVGPGNSSSHATLNNVTATDIFCSSQVIMPETGNILISGGDNWTGSGTTNTGNNNSNVFSSIGGANTLTRQTQNMNRSRWYSSSTVLVNGDIYVQGGSGGADFPEVRQQNGSYRLLTAAGTGGFDSNFPRNWLSPDGRIFGYDTSGRMYFISAAGTGSVAPQTPPLPSANAGWTSGAVMFDVGKILQFGGNSNGATVIDITGPVPSATPTQSMSTKRMWVSATVLPDGKVLATGGSEVENQLNGVNNSAEIWDPATGSWHVGTAGAKARLYHSGALLLPDATVLVSGGGAPGPQTNTNAEIYSPPYLYNSSGALAVRPQITSWPSTAQAGDTLTYQVQGSVARMVLIKTGSTTHSVNMDQRYVPLPTTVSGTTVTAKLPVRDTDAPPGFYMAFAVGPSGVPSVAKMLRINISATPNTAVDFTQTMGGGGGSPFNLACLVDEVLVGVHGRYSTSVINQVGPQCVKVDQFGRWIGDPVKRPVTGSTTTGTLFDKVCARDSAVSGFRGSAGTLVNQIELQCRALTPSGGLTGTGTFLGSSGGTGGTAQPLQTCGTGNPGYALYGRSGASLDAFGMLCRTGAITPISVNNLPVIVNPGAQTWVVGSPVSLQITATDANLDPLTYSATSLPAGLSIGPSTGLITGTPTAPNAGQATITVSDGTGTDSEIFAWTVSGTAPLSVQPMPPQTSKLAGSTVTYTATATGGVNVRYKWQFGDGTPETPLSSSASASHVYSAPGIYFLTLSVTDDVVATPLVQQFVQTIHLPPTAVAPRSSSQVAYETRTTGNSRLWVVNQDNDSVSVFDAVTNARIAEIAVGVAPRSVAIAPDGRIWVVNSRADTISIVSPTSLGVVQTVNVPFGSQPYGIVFSPAANRALVVLAGSGSLLALDATSGAQLGVVSVGPNPRHVAIDGAGTNAYVSRFITAPQPGEATAIIDTQTSGADVVVVDPNAMALRRTLVLAHSTKPDFENQGSGVPNYLGALAISPDGRSGFVPSKQDNIGRGMLRSGANLNFQSTVRAVSSRLDLVGNVEDLARRIDHNDAGVASAAVYDRYGVYLFVALETSREVAVIDATNSAQLFRIFVGRAPQALVLSPDSRRLYVSNFMDRTVDTYDLSALQDTGQWTAPRLASQSSVATERLAANVLLGKQLFYDARDTRLARDRYMSCASCHNDGGADGRTWDLTGMGEGLRNTISLRGTAAKHGRLHWTANFDEVQDFEGQIRSLAGGTGLMTDASFNTGTRNQPLGDPKAGQSSDLDALAAYVGSLNAFAPSPYRTSAGALTSDAVAGKALFSSAGCATCHSGRPFTNSPSNSLENIGTIKPSSGQRLGAPLTGLDTPTLCSVWQNAPYLHDGSAASLGAAITAHSGTSFNASDLAQLAAYVQQIDAVTAPDCANAVPGLLAAYSFDEGAGTAVLDRAENSNTGSVQGTVAWTTAGKNGGALDFNGTNTRVQIPASPTLNPTGGLTLEAWVFPTVSQAGWRAIIQKEVDAWFLHASSGGTLMPAAGGTYAGAVATTFASTSIPANAWTHLAQTYDGATIRLYVNGVLASSLPKTGALETNTSPLSIGGTNAYGEFFQGRIDDVRVYNRALSISEITSDMNTPAGQASAGDTTPPSAPGTLTATAASATQINLSWVAATDNVGVTGYRVERCTGAGCTTFAQVATSTGTSFNDTGLTASTSYSYRVRAVDAAGNSGAFSSTGSATTQAAADTTPPSAPGTLTATAVSATQINLSWVAATDNVGVTGYRLERCTGAGCTTFAQIATPAGTTFNDTGLTASTSYSYRVRAVDAAGLSGAFSSTGSATTQAAGDTTPPGAPGTLAATASSATQINLAWGAATDNVGVTGYQVERCSGVNCTSFAPIATPAGTSMSDTGLADATSYSYRVRAVDAAGNSGLFSNTSSATTPDATPPGAPSTLTATAVSATQIDVSWSAATDNVGVTGYRLERCTGAGCTTFAQIAGLTGTTYSDPGLAGTTSYSYRVRAVDAAGNTGPFSNTSSATTLDTTPPSAPGTLTTTATSATQINLAWGAATDNVGVTGYRVERCTGVGCTTFAQVATPTGTSFNDTGLAGSTSYSYRVRAVDAAGNPGAFTNTSTATTQVAVDTTPPTAPSLSGTATSTQINLSWSGATDDVGVTGYRLERCSGPGCTNFAQIAAQSGTTFSDTGLAATVQYSYRVRAVDAAGNLSTFSNVVKTKLKR